MLQDADKKGLATISEEVKKLADKARENKLRPEEFQVPARLVSQRLIHYQVKVQMRRSKTLKHVVLFTCLSIILSMSGCVLH